MNDKTPGELDAEHFRRLDLEQLKLEAHSRDIETKAKWEAEKIRRNTEYVLTQAKMERRKWWRYFFSFLSVPAVAAALVWGGMGLWGNDGPKTPEQMKQDRWKSCMQDHDFGGSPTQVWFPEEQGGQGLCLPKGQNPPGK